VVVGLPCGVGGSAKVRCPSIATARLHQSETRLGHRKQICITHNHDNFAQRFLASTTIHSTAMLDITMKFIISCSFKKKQKIVNRRCNGILRQEYVSPANFKILSKLFVIIHPLFRKDLSICVPVVVLHNRSGSYLKNVCTPVKRFCRVFSISG
jgi:hypothetical protein